MYKIKYTYNTGDSFHTEEGLESFLEFSWENIEVAKANLNRIKEHYKLYKELTNVWDFEQGQEELKKAAKNDWFASHTKTFAYNEKEKSKHPANYYPIADEKSKKAFEKAGHSFYNGLDFQVGTHSLKLQLDNGKFVQFGAPWCGYFETLISVEIETDNHKIYL